MYWLVVPSFIEKRSLGGLSQNDTGILGISGATEIIKKETSYSFLEYKLLWDSPIKYKKYNKIPPVIYVEFSLDVLYWNKRKEQ